MLGCGMRSSMPESDNEPKDRIEPASSMAAYYNDNADALFSQYQAMNANTVHAGWRHLLPGMPGLALDIGAGSGRDAAWLAGMGWDVVAAEPAIRLRHLGETATEGLSVHWVDEALPELRTLRAHSYRFDLILLSAVWMHVPATRRQRAFRILTELLAPGGQLVITLRQGPDQAERGFHAAAPEELEALARQRALLTAHRSRGPDAAGRPDVSWDTLVFRLPDDGTGALPLLRHVVVNDSKASTYKLGLLRSLTRIADGYPGMVLRRDEDWVELPLGLVGLIWIRLYQPLLLQHNLRQSPGSSGYGFATDAFSALGRVSPGDLRPGQSLGADLASVVLQAIRDACRTITNMPVRYTTHPGSQRKVFETSSGRQRLPRGPVRLDRETLTRFGVLRVPTLLWDCFSRYACWLEPAIVNEWTSLMQGYEVRYDDGIYARALAWQESRRDTSLVRQLVQGRLDDGESVRCVWSESDLRRRRFDVDHCFPWSRWSNNDLWNLLPASSMANARKGERLPSAPLLHARRETITDWWNEAFAASPRREQFFLEAQAALPAVDDRFDVQAVFDGLLHQRTRLKTNQQLAEWRGLTDAFE